MVIIYELLETARLLLKTNSHLFVKYDIAYQYSRRDIMWIFANRVPVPLKAGLAIEQNQAKL